MKTQHQHNMRSSCISLSLSPSSRAHAPGCGLEWILSVAVRPRRRCNGAAALAPLLKSGGRRAGATVWGVFEQGAQKSSERTVIFFSPPLASDLQQHPSRASWQIKHSSLLTFTWPRSLRHSSSTFGNTSTLTVGPEKLCQSQYLRGLTE